jgi:hypothetical protein
MTDFRSSIGFQVPANGFAYQAGRQHTPSHRLQETSPMRGSIQELKVVRHQVKEMHGFDVLPGFSEPILTDKDVNEEIDNISHTIREEREKASTVNMLTTSQKVKYIVLLVLLAVCRSSLYPLMAAVAQPIVHKLIWRSLLVAF